MKYKMKAYQIIDSYCKVLQDEYKGDLLFIKAKQCALIGINATLNFALKPDAAYEVSKEWEQIKNEIENF